VDTNIPREEDNMDGLFGVLVVAALAALTLSFLFVPTKKHRDGGYGDLDRHWYVGEAHDGVYRGTYGGGVSGDHGSVGGTCDGAGSFGGGDCGGGC
jgi:hypothetical protein